MQSLKNTSQISKQTSCEEVKGEKVNIQLDLPSTNNLKLGEKQWVAATFASIRFLQFYIASFTRKQSSLYAFCKQFWYLYLQVTWKGLLSK